jgi:ABC-2 type transport system permease protein
MSNSIADLLPDRAGQVALHETWDGAMGPWTGLAVIAVWTAAAPAAGAWRVRRREADPGKSLTPRQLSVAAGLLEP